MCDVVLVGVGRDKLERDTIALKDNLAVMFEIDCDAVRHDGLDLPDPPTGFAGQSHQGAYFKPVRHAPDIASNRRRGQLNETRS